MNYTTCTVCGYQMKPIHFEQTCIVWQCACCGYEFEESK